MTDIPNDQTLVQVVFYGSHELWSGPEDIPFTVVPRAGEVLLMPEADGAIRAWTVDDVAHKFEGGKAQVAPGVWTLSGAIGWLRRW